MSILPVFKIGLWNAWIILVLLLAVGTVPLFFDKEKIEKRAEGEPPWNEQTKTSKIVFVITHLTIMPFTLISSIFLPLKLDTLWFYVGLPICLIALCIGLMFGISFATAPTDKPISKGIFTFSRHPGYFSFFLGCIGIGITCASWVFLFTALVWIISWHFGVVDEERLLLEKYGDDYREYRNRTPKWIGFPKSK